MPSIGSTQPKQVAELLEACLAHVQQPTTVPLPPTAVELALLESSSSEGNQPQQSFHQRSTGKQLETVCWSTDWQIHCRCRSSDRTDVCRCIHHARNDKGTLTIESVADGVPIRIRQGTDTVKELTVSKQGATTRLRAGSYTVEIEVIQRITKSKVTASR